MAFEIIGALGSIGAGVFMHKLIKAISEKYYLSWPNEAVVIVVLYFLGVLPCALLTWSFVDQIVRNL